MSLSLSTPPTILNPRQDLVELIQKLAEATTGLAGSNKGRSAKRFSQESFHDVSWLGLAVR